jgi:hypothetical protein
MMPKCNTIVLKMAECKRIIVEARGQDGVKKPIPERN